MTNEFHSYGEDLSKCGDAIVADLAKQLTTHRNLISEKRDQLFADNAILHALYMILSHHLTFIIAESRGEDFDETTKKIAEDVQCRLGKTMNELLSESLGDGSSVCFYKKNKENE